jgi:hypothetical protein
MISVQVPPRVPASHCKLYEVIVEPPSYGVTNAVQSTSI